MSEPLPEGAPAHIRSFHARHGRISELRRSALEQLLPLHDLRNFPTPINLREALSSDYVIVDFGCGMGENTRQLAAQSSTHGILAVDVHTAGITDLLMDIEKCGWQHVRVFFGDGYELFRDSLSNGCIDEIHVLFPDPWPKARHNKRRLIQIEFLELCHRLLAPGGVIRVISDWPDYIVHTDDIFHQHPSFEAIDDSEPIPMTGYHAKAIREGRFAEARSFRRIDT